MSQNSKNTASSTPNSNAQNLASEPINTPNGKPVYGDEASHDTVTQEKPIFFFYDVVKRTLLTDTILRDDDDQLARYVHPELAFTHLAETEECDLEDAKLDPKNKLVVYYVRAVTEVDAEGNPVHWKNALRQTEQLRTNYRTGERAMEYATSPADNAAMQIVQKHRREAKEAKVRAARAETRELNQMQARFLAGMKS